MPSFPVHIFPKKYLFMSFSSNNTSSNPYLEGSAPLCLISAYDGIPYCNNARSHQVKIPYLLPPYLSSLSLTQFFSLKWHMLHSSSHIYPLSDLLWLTSVHHVSGKGLKHWSFLITYHYTNYNNFFIISIIIIKDPDIYRIITIY